MRVPCLLAVASLLFVGLGFAPGFAPTDPPANDDATISDVMNEAMKGGLLRKSMGDEGTAEDKLRVLDLLISLSENDPPQGDADEWKAMTQKALTDYARFMVGREGAAELVQASTNCKACHDKFKP